MAPLRKNEADIKRILLTDAKGRVIQLSADYLYIQSYFEIWSGNAVNKMAAEESKGQAERPSAKKHLGIPEAVFLVCCTIYCDVSGDLMRYFSHLCTHIRTSLGCPSSGCQCIH